VLVFRLIVKLRAQQLTHIVKFTNRTVKAHLPYKMATATSSVNVTRCELLSVTSLYCGVESCAQAYRGG